MNETVQKVIEQQEQVDVVSSGMKGNYLPAYSFFGFVQADLQVFSFLEVSDGNNMAHIVVDGMERGNSVNRTRQIINKRGNHKIKIRDTYL